MLQALELTNGTELSGIIQRGAQRWTSQTFASTAEMIERIYQNALGRVPSSEELRAAEELIGSPARAEGVEDLIWSLVMLPEFQLIY
jgi:predicted metal-dependent hydrolase